MFKSLKLPAGGEIGIVALVIAIISLMILPLPPVAIDLLLGINITISVTLLMVTMYVPDIAALSAFPSLLLFTTLFRLSLNIASTKSICCMRKRATLSRALASWWWAATSSWAWSYSPSSRPCNSS